MDTSKVMSRALAGIDNHTLASLMEIGEAAESDPGLTLQARINPDIITAAVGVLVVLLVLTYLLPMAAATTMFTVEATIEGAEFSLELIDGLYQEYPAARGALHLLAALGGGATIQQIIQSKQP